MSFSVNNDAEKGDKNAEETTPLRPESLKGVTQDQLDV